MDLENLQKTLVDSILELLKDNNPDSFFKEFYYGDKDEYQFSELPCISVEPVETNIVTGPTGMDDIEQMVTIRVIYNKRDEMGREDGEVIGVRNIQLMVEGMDPTTGEYDSRTIAGILRKNYTLQANALGQKMQIRYGIVPRPGGDDTSECQITFTVGGLKVVSGRT